MDTAETRPRGYTLFACSTDPSMHLIMLINVKMPTIVVGILTFICTMNRTSWSLKARNAYFLQHFIFMSS